MHNPTAAKTIPVFNRQIGSWRISIGREAFTGEDICKIYDNCADSWSKRLSFLGAPGAYQSAWQAVFDLLPSMSGHRHLRVLDCGIGDGAFSAALARTHPGSLDLHGVDLSRGMLDQARSNLLRTGIHPTLWPADCQELPFEDASFDLVISAHMIEHLADPQKALCEMHRVLKPGGTTVAAITRRSALGRMIQLGWRTQSYRFEDVSQLLLGAGFQSTIAVPPTGHRLQNQLSLFCVGRKPLAIAASPATCHQETF